ncbi:unnamed protein product [Closterium sp. Yama58-4]|nr:unnamed protein product [Closterium sp. Yama58-4]
MHGVPAVVTSSHGHRHASFLAAARPSPRSLGALCLLAVAALALLAAAVHSPLGPRLAARRATSPRRVHSIGPSAFKSADHLAPAASQPSILPLPLGSHDARGRQVGSPTTTAPSGDADAGGAAGTVLVAAATTDGQLEPLMTAGATAGTSAVTEPSTAASETAEAYVAGVPEQCSMQRSTDYDGDALTWGLDFHTASAADCCARCQAMAATAHAAAQQGGEGAQQRCNIWVFCPEPGGCWSPDIWDHKHKECWLKYGDPPKLNFQGRYAKEFRAMHPTAPEAVQWVAGVI